MSDREEVAEQPIVSNEDVSLHGNGDVEVKVPRKAVCRSRPKSRKGMPSLRRLSSKLKVSKSGRQSLNVSMVHAHIVITIYLFICIESLHGYSYADTRQLLINDFIITFCDQPSGNF